MIFREQRQPLLQGMFSASQQEEMNPRKCTHLLAIQSVFMATHRVYIQTISIFSTVFAMKLVRYNMKNFNRAPSAETLLQGVPFERNPRRNPTR